MAAPGLENPVLDEYLAKQAKRGPARPPSILRGALPADSIFGAVPGEADSEGAVGGEGDAPALTAAQRDARHQQLMAVRLDPDPASRRRWERKMVIRTLRRGGRLTKAELLLRTERQCLYRSPVVATSAKKLTKLLRQIAGKTLDDAVTQMRFSSKRAARDVWRGLEVARDEAVAARGMGLHALRLARMPPADRARAHAKLGDPVEVVLKNGSRKLVRDRTEIYVDQAWVGKSGYQREPNYRGKGQVDEIQHRFATFSVLLKEEATRIREHEERKHKQAGKKVWVHLPDRPITAQRQYCLW